MTRSHKVLSMPRLVIDERKAVGQELHSISCGDTHTTQVIFAAKAWRRRVGSSALRTSFAKHLLPKFREHKGWQPGLAVPLQVGLTAYVEGYCRPQIL